MIFWCIYHSCYLYLNDMCFRNLNSFPGLQRKRNRGINNWQNAYFNKLVTKNIIKACQLLAKYSTHTISTLILLFKKWLQWNVNNYDYKSHQQLLLNSFLSRIRMCGETMCCGSIRKLAPLWTPASTSFSLLKGTLLKNNVNWTVAAWKSNSNGATIIIQTNQIIQYQVLLAHFVSTAPLIQSERETHRHKERERGEKNTWEGYH